MRSIPRWRDTVKKRAREQRERVENIPRDADARSAFQPASVAHSVSATVIDVSAETCETSESKDSWETWETLAVLDTPPSRIRRARSTCWQRIQTPSS